MATQISDFFGTYPEIYPQIPTGESLFNTLISRKQEFVEATPALTEEPPVRGGAFKHQKMAVRYLTWYDRLFLLHDPGTGKSCIIAHSAELYKNEYLKDPDDPTKIRRAVILLRGPILKENIKNEIVCKCTERVVYETEMVTRATLESTMKGAISRGLDKWYDIMTYHTFATIINKFTREEDLAEYMSRKAIYVDEAHNVPKLSDIRSIAEIGTEIGETEEDYETIHRAFHKGENNILVLATATPMRNSPIDIIPLINLITPLDLQMPRWRLDQEEEFASLPLEFFEPYFRGRISYIRALITGAQEIAIGVNPEVEGVPIYTKIFMAGMSEFQYRVYLNAVAADTGGKNRRVAVFENPRQSSNFVYPDGSYGSAGFDKYLEKTTAGYQIKKNPDGDRLRSLLVIDNNNPDPLYTSGLQVMSAKFYQMTLICNSAYADRPAALPLLQQRYPDIYRQRTELATRLQREYPELYRAIEQVPGAELVLDDSRGIVFVFFADYVQGSGAIMFGKCLEANGYEEFRETTSIFISTRESGRSFGPCTSYEEVSSERSSRRGKRRRYAILSGSDVTPKAQIKNILDTVNSYENRFGEYLQVIIGSRSAREGISINNASRRMMASSSWNYSANYQANERVFRSTSHIYRLADKKRLFQAAGIQTDNLVFNVQTYNMASVYRGDPQATEPILRDQNIGTIDVEMFAQSERKDRLNRKIMRYMKQSSYDCHINYERNVRPNIDIAGTPTCDYMECAYVCAGIRQELLRPLDRSTKILYYSTEEVSDAVNAVRRLFSRFYSLTIEQVHQAIRTVDPAMDPLFINMAIEKMIRENTRLNDRMGFFGYLRESGSGVIYLEKDPFEVRDQPENTAYSSVLIGTQDPNNNSFYDYAVGIQLSTEEPLIRQIKGMNPDDPEFVIVLNKLSIVSKVHLLEEAYNSRIFRDEDSDLIEGIISAFQNSVYKTNEPRDLLRKVALNLANKGKTRGRKPNPNKQPKIEKLGLSGNFPLPEYDTTDLGELVYLHTIYNQASHNRTEYSAVNRFLKADGKIRILKPSEKIGWRDVNAYEHISYNNIIRQNINAIQAEYERFEIYGIMIPPRNQLHIRDRERESSATNEGRVCNNWNKPDLVDILYRLGVRYPYSGESFNREAVIQYLYGTRPPIPASFGLEQFEDEKLVHFYYWYQNPEATRDKICDILKDFFERNGMLFTGRVSRTVPIIASVGSINVAPELTEPDYSQPFQIPTTSTVPVIPSQIMPQFAASAPDQPPPQPVIILDTIPRQTELVQHTQTPFTQPPNDPYAVDIRR